MWSITKALQIPLDNSIKNIQDIPHTISFVIRKNQMVDSLSELQKEKRPPDRMIWFGKPEELEEWVENVTGRKKSQNTFEFEINEGDIG